MFGLEPIDNQISVLEHISRKACILIDDPFLSFQGTFFSVVKFRPFHRITERIRYSGTCQNQSLSSVEIIFLRDCCVVLDKISPIEKKFPENPFIHRNPFPRRFESDFRGKSSSKETAIKTSIAKLGEMNLEKRICDPETFCRR